MSANIERFKSELDGLIATGEQLDFAMVYEVDPSGFTKQATQQLGTKEKVKELINKLPDFKVAYEAWYSEAIALLRQILPDRLQDFVALYERPRNRKRLPGYSDYVMHDYMQNLQVSRGGETIADKSAAVPKFRQQLAILKAARRRFESALFEIRQLVQADLFDTEIDGARELLKSKFSRAAGTIAGVILEKHLRQACEHHNINISKKHPTLADLNELLKSNSVIEIPQWRHIPLLADIRNLCAHNKSKEPSAGEVEDLIDGVVKVIKTIS